MGITSLMLEQQDYERNTQQMTGSSVGKDNIESLGLIMASSSLLLNLINNLLDVKKATANSKCTYRTQITRKKWPKRVLLFSCYSH